MSPMENNGTASGPVAIGARAKDAATQAIPVGKRAGTTAVQGVRQGVQGAREWAAPRLEDAAVAVDTTVAPKVSSALRSTASQVRPSEAKKTGVRRLLDWRLILGLGVAAAAAGAGAAVAMRRRYASATAEAKSATEDDSDAERAAQGDAAAGSEVNGRVTAPGG